MLDLELLRAEIEADPRKLGLAEMLGEGRDAAVADALNAGTGPAQAAAVQTAAIVALIRPRDMPFPSSRERAYLDTLLAMRGEVVITPELLSNLGDVFGAGSETMNAIRLVATRPGSRAEELWGRGTRVNHDDVAACYAVERTALYEQQQAPLDAVKAALDVEIAELVLAARSGDTRRLEVARVAVGSARESVHAELVKGGAVFDEGSAGAFLLPPEEVAP